MSRLVLANRDYGPAVNGWGAHMTSEGYELQSGLEAAGWTLVGHGYDDGCRDVPRLIERYRPEVVIVSDKRDWDPKSMGSFRKDVGFQRIEELAKHPQITKIAVVKDAGSVVPYHKQLCQEIDADAVLTYYHADSVTRVAPFLRKYPLLRTYHTVDMALASSIDLAQSRKRALVSGAVSQVYPLRQMAFQHAGTLGLTTLPHPGYSNKGSKTPEYLKTLARYRVHVACSSAYGFALRKIIESVAMGCTPVTDLPDYDVLPEIDKALIRVSAGVSLVQLRRAIDSADAGWNLDERLHYAKHAQEFYGHRHMGLRLTEHIDALKALNV